MGRKVLQDYANKVCEMLVGWRFALAKDDIPRLIAIGSGELEIDLLRGSNRVDGVLASPFGIVDEVSAWLRERRDLDGIAVDDDLQEATVHLRFRAAETARSRRFPVRELDYDCASIIRTDERTYMGAVTKGKRWVGSRGGAPWVVTDR